MTDVARQRRLSVQGRLADLRARHGAEDAVLPDWLDSMEGFLSCRRPTDLAEVKAPVRRMPPANGRAGHSAVEPVGGPPVIQRADFGDLDV